MYIHLAWKSLVTVLGCEVIGARIRVVFLLKRPLLMMESVTTPMETMAGAYFIPV
jgi:hypothetical protein